MKRVEFSCDARARRCFKMGYLMYRNSMEEGAFMPVQFWGSFCYCEFDFAIEKSWVFTFSLRHWFYESTLANEKS
ncbi:hypothetical protein SDJN03_16821, partial [Cucurbita argyrosperma subsp. sororia]